MKLSIIIPVYNEEATIAKLIDKVGAINLPKSVRKEIIVVDDASIDSSSEKASKVKGIKLKRHKKNLGKGAAVKTGIEASTGEIIIIQDADLEYDPNDIPRLVKPIIDGKAKVVYGSRLKNYPLKLFGKNKTPLITHFIGNKFLTFITNMLYGDDVTDMETCYKVFKKEVLDEIEINSKGFEFEPEITAKILKKGYEIYEVSIKVKPRGYDEGKKITWKDGFAAVWTLLKYRFVD